MTNCFDLKCPKCKGTNQIDIFAEAWVRLTQDGTDADISHDGGHYWTADSVAGCSGCGHSGLVKDFEGEV